MISRELLSQGQVLGRQAEQRSQKCSEQQANQLNQAHEEVSPGCREPASLLASRPRSESRNSLTAFMYGVIGRDTGENASRPWSEYARWEIRGKQRR